MAKRILIFTTIAFLLLLVVAPFMMPDNNTNQPPQVQQETAVEQIDREPYLDVSIPELERVSGTRASSGAIDNTEYLDDSLLHVRSSGYPWQEDKNVYVAGHRLGYPNTDSYLVFYNLDKLENGDKIVLEDSKGNEYAYAVTDKKVVEPDDLSVLEPTGKDTVTLQTCTLPNYEDRYVVIGERVD